MAKRNKKEFSTLQSKVPDVVTYTVLILLFILAVKLVQKLAGFSIPLDMFGPY